MAHSCVQRHTKRTLYCIYILPSIYIYTYSGSSSNYSYSSWDVGRTFLEPRHRPVLQGNEAAEQFIHRSTLRIEATVSCHHCGNDNTITAPPSKSAQMIKTSGQVQSTTINPQLRSPPIDALTVVTLRYVVY